MNMTQIVTVSQASHDEEVLEMFLAGKRRSAGTRRVYATELAKFCAAVPKPLHQVTLRDLQLYAEGLEESLAPASVGRALSTVRSLFRFAHRLGYLPFNPAELLELPRVPVTSGERFLTKEEVKALLNEVKDHPRNLAITGLLVKTGLRVEEVASLNWSDFYQDMGGRFGLRVTGKGGKRRTVKVTPDLWGRIQAYRQSEGRPVALDSEDHSPLFVSRAGGRLSDRYIRKIITNAGQRAGIKKSISPHWLRHTHATLAVVGGASLQQVQAALGHSDPRTTARYEHSAKVLTETAADFVGVTV